jgi:triphosphoribosyl-dephospho-CoA synthetase
VADLASALGEGLRRELDLTPKPGLVDREGCGAHRDLSFPLMERSIALVAAYLGEVAGSVARGAPLTAQVALARQAEGRMLEVLGTNTHKGAIFLGGLVLVADGRRGGGDDEASLRQAIGAVAIELAPLRGGGSTHGEAARRAFHVGGILAEAARGLPAVFEAALPAFRSTRARGQDEEAAAFAMLAALMQVVEDTTALHRCGPAGLLILREDGARLAGLVEAGSHLPFLRARSEAYRKLGLTMGGVADLLGLAFGWLGHRGELIDGPPR